MTPDEFSAKYNVQPAAPMRLPFAADDECRVCRATGYSKTDGVFGRCWCCLGTGARGAATTGAYVP